MPPTLTKAERAQQLIDEAAAQRLERLACMRHARCEACDRLMFLYIPPAYVVVKCKRCGSWNHIRTEAPPP